MKEKQRILSKLSSYVRTKIESTPNTVSFILFIILVVFFLNDMTSFRGENKASFMNWISLFLACFSGIAAIYAVLVRSYMFAVGLLILAAGSYFEFFLDI